MLSDLSKAGSCLFYGTAACWLLTLVEANALLPVSDAAVVVPEMVAGCDQGAVPSKL